jgi:hypothetical protein
LANNRNSKNDDLVLHMNTATINLIISLSTLVGFVIVVYRTFRDPDQKAETEIALLKQGCNLKHLGIDEDILAMKKDLYLIKENHLTHIEKDIVGLRISVDKILTILDERNNNK